MQERSRLRTSDGIWNALRNGALVLLFICTSYLPAVGERLFPTNLPERQWVEFKAGGYSNAVCGTVFRADHPATCGMPLGGVATGCLDLDTTGTFGYMSIFNSLSPRRGPFNSPFLGLSIGGRTWALSAVSLPGVTSAKQIHYWGHYPVVDLEFETDAPVEVGLRAWSPFIPGDTKISMLPGVVFEVHLRNTTNKAQRGTLAFDFPGFDRLETLLAPPDRSLVGNLHPRHAISGLRPVKSEVMNGAYVRGESRDTTEYILAVLNDPAVKMVRVGRGLGTDGRAWQKIATALPAYEPREHINSATSVAADFSLAPREEITIRYILAWHAQVWFGAGTPLMWQWLFSDDKSQMYLHKYAESYPGAVDVANILARDHESLLGRIIAWQEVVYNDKSLPGWLQDSLINILHLVTECGIWAQAGPPIGDWCRKEDGLFGLNECPRSCPSMQTVACDWYGNIPLVYFFPDTVLSTLRGYKAYQNPNGCMSNFGALYSLSTPGEAEMRGQFNLDGPSMVDMIDRMWMCTGNDDILREFYDCAKRVTTFTMNLRPDYGPKQVLGVHPNGDHWFQSCDFRGLSPHVGGVRMAGLRMVRRMAEKMGDSDFVQECDEWLRAGSQVLENELWNGDYYLVCLEPETDRKQDLVFGYQLEGQWMAKFHGLPDVFRPDRVKATLGTIKKCNANKNLAPHGAFLFMRRDGVKAPDGPCGFWTREGSHPASDMMLAMTYLYAGNQTFGMDLLKRTMDTLTNKEGVVWDQPCIYRADTGAMIFGSDYYQNMMLWSVPAAIEGKDLSGPCERGGLVDRILRAAREK